MGAYPLLNLLNKLGKGEHIRGDSSILKYFAINKLNKFNITRARKLDFMYYMTLNLL